MEKCTTLELDVGGPWTLAATKTTSSPTTGATPVGTVKSTQTVPDSPALRASSFGSTLLTNLCASVTVILKVRLKAKFRTMNATCLVLPGDNTSNSSRG